VVVVADGGLAPVQALLRWDPAGFAGRELEDRQSAHLPPGCRLATLTGPATTVDSALGMLRLGDGAEVLGPVPVDEGSGAGRAEDEPTVRAVVRVPRRLGDLLSRALVEMQGVRDAKKMDPVRVQVDPVGLG
jgi:primosomal protein N' (replication factor Y)